MQVYVLTLPSSGSPNQILVHSWLSGHVLPDWFRDPFVFHRCMNATLLRRQQRDILWVIHNYYYFFLLFTFYFLTLKSDLQLLDNHRKIIVLVPLTPPVSPLLALLLYDYHIMFTSISTTSTHVYFCEYITGISDAGKLHTQTLFVKYIIYCCLFCIWSL